MLIRQEFLADPDPESPLLLYRGMALLTYVDPAQGIFEMAFSITTTTLWRDTCQYSLGAAFLMGTSGPLVAPLDIL